MMFLRQLPILGACCLLLAAPSSAAPKRQAWDDGWRAYQDTAPEYVDLAIGDVQRSSDRPAVGFTAGEVIVIQATVTTVYRTRTGLQPGQSITIHYVHKAAAGPTYGNTPVPPDPGAQVPAFLELRDGVYVPAARHHSFSPLTAQQLQRLQLQPLPSSSTLSTFPSGHPLPPPDPSQPFPAEPVVVVEPSRENAPATEITPAPPPPEPPKVENPPPPEPAPAPAEIPALTLTNEPPPEPASTPAAADPAPTAIPPPSTPVETPAAHRDADYIVVNINEPTENRIPVIVVPPPTYAKHEPTPPPSRDSYQFTGDPTPPPPAEKLPARITLPPEQPAALPTAPVPDNPYPPTPTAAPAPTFIAASTSPDTPPPTVPAPAETSPLPASSSSPEPVAIEKPAPPVQPPPTFTEMEHSSPNTPAPHNLPVPAHSDAMARYAIIFSHVREADLLLRQADPNKARALYTQAETDLLALKKEIPEFQPFMVQYRLNDVQRKLQGMQNAPAPTAQP